MNKGNCAKFSSCVFPKETAADGRTTDEGGKNASRMHREKNGNCTELNQSSLTSGIKAIIGYLMANI